MEMFILSFDHEIFYLKYVVELTNYCIYIITPYSSGDNYLNKQSCAKLST